MARVGGGIVVPVRPCHGSTSKRSTLPGLSSRGCRSQGIKSASARFRAMALALLFRKAAGGSALEPNGQARGVAEKTEPSRDDHRGLIRF